MELKGTAAIETERLILRRFELSDAEDMFRNWASSEKVTRFLTWQPYEDAQGARDYIQTVIGGYDKGEYNWMIDMRGGQRCIGSISVVEYREDTASAEIGYCLGEAYWGQGIMTEAAKAVMQYLFYEEGFNRVQAVHDVNNPASGRVMEKCGLKYEGTLRQEGKNNQGICDIVIRAALRADFE